MNSTATKYAETRENFPNESGIIIQLKSNIIGAVAKIYINKYYIYIDGILHSYYISIYFILNFHYESNSNNLKN